MRASRCPGVDERKFANIDVDNFDVRAMNIDETAGGGKRAEHRSPAKATSRWI